MVKLNSQGGYSHEYYTVNLGAGSDIRLIIDHLFKSKCTKISRTDCNKFSRQYRYQSKMLDSNMLDITEVIVMERYRIIFTQNVTFLTFNSWY